MTKQTLSLTDNEPRWSTRQRVWRYGPLLLWLVFISLASTSGFSAANTSRLVGPFLRWFFPNISEEGLALAHFITRKVAHFAEYAVLALFARRAFITSSHTFIQRYWFQLGLLLVVIYALLDELHQSLGSSRTGSIYDSALDIAGGLTVLLFFKLYDREGRKRELQGSSG